MAYSNFSSKEKMKKRFLILGKLIALAAMVILLAWCIISLIYNSTSRTLAEQLTFSIELPMIWFGIAVFLIFAISLVGTLVNRIRNKTENFFGFLYFLVFSIALISVYLIAFYHDIVK
jgi:hypothetical protein